LRYDAPLEDIARALRERRVSAADLAEEAIARHERDGAALNAYKTWQPEIVRAAARAADAMLESGQDGGLLYGLPVSVKDLYGVPDWPTFAGAARRLPERWERAGPLIGALRSQRAVIAGKTHTVEFAIGSLGTNPHWGTPRNPWDRTAHRVPGGSSSGAGVSLQEGSALLALGSDTAGSVRTPAAMTGCVGLKPTAGRWPSSGLVPLCPRLDSPGPLARSVHDCAYAFAALDPAASQAPFGFLARVRGHALSAFEFGVADGFFWAECSPGVAEAIQRALQELASAGAKIRDVTVRGAREAFGLAQAGGLASADFARFIAAELPQLAPHLSAPVAARRQAGAEMPEAEYRARSALLDSLARDEGPANFTAVDVILAPTCPHSPPRLQDVEAAADYRRETMLALRNTCVANQLGYCALTMPAGSDALGLPVGLQLFAPGLAEERLLAAALAIERALGPRLPNRSRR
jgi:aspartyl-tRNA(Asn)/glutamyl-tRNA(Gln) amidotransferase subunit A